MADRKRWKPDPDLPPFDAVEALEALVASGHARRVDPISMEALFAQELAEADYSDPTWEDDTL